MTEIRNPNGETVSRFDALTPVGASFEELVYGLRELAEASIDWWNMHQNEHSTECVPYECDSYAARAYIETRDKADLFQTALTSRVNAVRQAISSNLG